MNIKSVIIIIQYVAIGILVFELLYSFHQKPSKLQPHVIILLISTILMFVGYIVEINALSIDVALQGAYMSYLGKPFIMVETFMLVAIFFGRNIPKFVYYLLFVFASVFPIVLYSNPIHHLFYSTESFDIAQTFSPLILEHGPLYKLYVFTTIAFFVGCFYIIIMDIIKNRNSYISNQRRMIRLLTSLMIIFSLAGYAVFLLKLTDNYDSTMIGVFLGVICLFIIFVKYKIFDAVTLAKDRALNDASIGLLIYDSQNNIVYSNSCGELLLSDNDNCNFINSLTSSTANLFYNDLIYSVHKNEIYVDTDYIGKSIEFSDITYSYNYQATLEKEVKARTEKINEFQTAIVTSLADMVEARSLETGDHTKRTRDYTYLIANGLKKAGLFSEILTDDYINLLTLASPLHDIGKISISDTILLKPGKLSHDEFEIMKEHSENGALLIERTMGNLENKEFIKIACDVARYHHERWDGLGYPQKLKENEIPLAARIVAVADCFDAITSERCYKPKYSTNEALEIIKSECGTHFDPDIVNIFLNLF